MNRPKFPLAVVIFLLVLFTPVLLAQTYCEDGNGPLNRNALKGIATADVIQKFAAKEAVFKQARDNYAYTLGLTVQTLEGHTVDGEFREITDITYDHKGNRIETVIYAPQSTLQRISTIPEDYRYLKDLPPFVMTTEDLPQYDILYVGTQHVDLIDTYVFDIAPKRVEKDKRYFRGRIWVDNHDLQIVKTCGQNVPYSPQKNDEDWAPRFVTYREQFDGQYWFPTYRRADDVLHFSGGDIHFREVIKYTRYRRFVWRTKTEGPPK